MVKVNQRSFAGAMVRTGCPGETTSPGSATSRVTTPSTEAESVVLGSSAAFDRRNAPRHGVRRKGTDERASLIRPTSSFEGTACVRNGRIPDVAE